jgi:hypothetical protein
VLSECERKGLRKLELFEVVAICDHLSLLTRRNLKHEVFGEPFPVTLNLLIQSTCRDPVKLRKVGVNDDFYPADQQNALLDTAYLDDGFR